VFDPPFAASLDHQKNRNLSPEPPVVNVTPAASASPRPTMTTTAMYPNKDTLGERLRLYVEEIFHDA